MNYADVILPVPLQDHYTYSVPAELSDLCRPGMRALVTFGQTKTYAALIVRLHDDAPRLDADKVKPLLSLLDAGPVVLPHQLKLWRWIASYYMSPLGEVMKAALPSGLKADTTFRPRTETCVALGVKFRTPQALATAQEMLRRSPRLSAVFLTYLQLAGLSVAGADDGAADVLRPKEVTREELMNEAHCVAAHVRRLVDQGFLATFEREVGGINQLPVSHPENMKPLTEPQLKAKAEIEQWWQQKNVVLLHGVTSSGKTEIYIHLIAEAIAQGRQVLYLLPEIALTVQMTERLRRVFGQRLAIYHSRYSDAERVEIWHRQLSAHPYDVILGARSAVFLPFQRLGLVIVDEEHENSFKQYDPAPRYHARSTAIVLAQQFGAKTLLGTATPSTESYYNAQTGKYGLVRLSTRFKGVSLPTVEVVDIKDLRHRKMMQGPFSPRLLGAMREALESGRQVILFQNRRGFAPTVSCNVCGWTPHCKNCDVALTYHKRLNLLTCHYCGYTEKVPEVCPQCGNNHLTDRGYGTEKIEDLVRGLFPEARISRMDLDTTRTQGAYARIISEFGSGKTNVLIGTQMISKGLDFSGVAVVGILDADAMLNQPDFRAYEHAFMMMSQVAGRAGRRDQRGRVILQTRDPHLPVIRQVVNHDYEGFYKSLLQERSMFHYPPFTRLIYVYLRHKDDAVVEMAAQEMGASLRRSFGDSVLGPDKPAVARVKTLCIRKIVLKLGLHVDLRLTRTTLWAAREAMISQKAYKALQIVFDVDPQ